MSPASAELKAKLRLDLCRGCRFRYPENKLLAIQARHPAYPRVKT
jgi:hypothetical protein